MSWNGRRIYYLVEKEENKGRGKHHKYRNTNPRRIAKDHTITPGRSLEVRALYPNTHSVVRERAVLVNGVHLGDFGADGLPLEHRLLFSFREQRYLVVDVFQHDEHSSLGSELLRPVVLQKNLAAWRISVRKGEENAPPGPWSCTRLRRTVKALKSPSQTKHAGYDRQRQLCFCGVVEKHGYRLSVRERIIESEKIETDLHAYQNS